MANNLAQETPEQPEETNMTNTSSNYVEPPSWLKDFISHKSTAGPSTSTITNQLTQGVSQNSPSPYTQGSQGSGTFDLAKHNKAMSSLIPEQPLGTLPADFNPTDFNINLGGSDNNTPKYSFTSLDSLKPAGTTVVRNSDGTVSYVDNTGFIVATAGRKPGRGGWRITETFQKPPSAGNAGGSSGGTSGGNTGGRARKPEPVPVDTPRPSTSQYRTDMRYRYYRNLMNTNPSVFRMALDRLKFINPQLAEVLGIDFNKMMTRKTLDKWREVVGLPASNRETQGVF